MENLAHKKGIQEVRGSIPPQLTYRKFLIKMVKAIVFLSYQD